MIGWLAAAALASFQDCAGCPTMFEVPAGRFEMGSTDAETRAVGLDAYFADREKPRRAVEVAAFALGRTEVTRGQFAAFVAATGHRPPRGCFVFEGARWRLDPKLGWDDPGFVQRDDEPAVCLARTDAVAYAVWLTARTGRAYRLPSEAEWEFAARAGTTTAYPWGERYAPDGCRFANAGDRSTGARFGWAGKSMNLAAVPPWTPAPCDDGHAATAPGDSLEPNPWGFRHLVGNAQEWVADCLNLSHVGAPATAEARRDGDCARGVLKGQGWTGTPAVLRPAFRLNGPADERRFSWGFRVAASPAKAAVPAAPPAPPASPPPDATARYAPLETVVGVPRPRDPPVVPRRRVDWSAVDRIAQASRSYALLVWQGGALRRERYWGGATAESRPEPASMAKTVLALAVGRAIAEGRIGSLDEPVARHLTEWRDDARGRITLRQLLQMASGLGPLSREGGPASPAARFQAGDGMVELMLGQRVAHAPGTWFEYQNSVSQLACLVLERATGERYASYLSRTLWRPLGAADARVWLDRQGAHPRCYASLLARPRDWLRIGRLLKDRGRANGRQLVPAAWIEAMARPSEANPNYGLQLWRAEPHAAERFYNRQRTGYAVPAAEPGLAADLVFLDGFGGQRVYVSRDADLVVVRLGDVDGRWDDSALPNAVLRALRGRR